MLEGALKAGARPLPAVPRPAPELPPVKGLLETSFIDWRGRISAVMFLPGCNFDCPYCHNHGLVADPDQYASLPLAEVLGRLRPFVGWIDGVVVSGGEPTLHPGLGRMLAAIKEAGFQVKLDTNGYRPAVLRRLVEGGLVDMVAMDLKAPLEPVAYARAAGRAVELARLRESIAFLVDSGVDHEFRSTIWPAWHGPRELAAMAEAVRGCRRWSLQALNPETAWRREALGRGRPYTARELAHLQATVAEAVCRAPA